MKARMAGGGPAQGAARVDAAFQQALLLQQQGRPFQAEALCAEVGGEPAARAAIRHGTLLPPPGGGLSDDV
jgi:hypothetical protein